MNVITVALKAAGILAEKMKPKDFHELGVKIIPHAVQQWKQKKSSIKLYNDQLFLYMITKVTNSTLKFTFFLKWIEIKTN